MSKRNAAVVLVAALVLGGAAVALAAGPPARPTVLAAAQAADPEAQAPEGQSPDDQVPDNQSPEDRRARRQALRTCMEQAGEDEAARRACLEAAGPGPGGPGPGHRIGRRGPGPAGPLGPGVLGRAVHGTVVVPDPDGGFHEVTFDRGRVDEATDGSQIVLDRPDGQTVTVALTGETEYHGVDDAAGIVDGRPALVVSQDGRALHVVQRDPSRKGGPGNNGDGPVVPND